MALEKQDLTYLTWSIIRHSSGTAGSFLKAYEQIGDQKIYYKLSDYDSMKGIIGHESINEIIVDRLLTVLGVEHLSYQLIYADVIIDSKVYSTYLCASENFRKRGESKVALDAFYERNKMAGETPLEFCIRNGWEDYIYQMLVIDFLILNRDRHGANIEVLQDPKAKAIRLAPIFDNGLSLVCSAKTDDLLEKFDVMEDKPVQCFVGSRSAYENLELIPAEKLPKFNPLEEADYERVFDDLETVLPINYRNKIWDMIWKRWCYYEDFCNSR
jgi:hypothetical protein